MVASGAITADELLTIPGDYELIRGALREVRPKGAESSAIALNIGAPLYAFVRSRTLGYVTGANGGYELFLDRRTILAPRCGFIHRDRVLRTFDRQHYFPAPPDLALEVVAPPGDFSEIIERVELYLAAGVRLVWLAIPKRRVVVVYRPGLDPKTLTENDELDGEDVIPGFRMAVREVFADPLAE